MPQFIHYIHCQILILLLPSRHSVSTTSPIKLPNELPNEVLCLPSCGHVLPASQFFSFHYFSLKFLENSSTFSMVSPYFQRGFDTICTHWILPHLLLTYMLDFWNFWSLWFWSRLWLRELVTVFYFSTAQFHILLTALDMIPTNLKTA